MPDVKYPLSETLTPIVKRAPEAYRIALHTLTSGRLKFGASQALEAAQAVEQYSKRKCRECSGYGTRIVRGNVANREHCFAYDGTGVVYTRIERRKRA